MNSKNYIRIFILIGFLVLLYFLNVPLQAIIFLGIFMFLLLLFRTRLYKKVDKTIRDHVHFISKFPEWLIRTIIIIIFILIYLAIKQVTFEVLKVFGLDIQKTMFDGINQSVKG